MNEKPSDHYEGERGTYQNVPAAVGSPGEKIAELARRDREERSVTHRDTLVDAPEFSPDNLPSEAAGVHRMPYEPRHYRPPTGDTAGSDIRESATGIAGPAELLYKLESIIRERPAPALVVAALTGFAIGRLVR